MEEIIKKQYLDELKEVWGKNIFNSESKDYERRQNNCLTAMSKYGENHWWLSQDTLEIAKYQLSEDILLVPFDKFHKGLEKLLGRPVFTSEF